MIKPKQTIKLLDQVNFKDLFVPRIPFNHHNTTIIIKKPGDSAIIPELNSNTLANNTASIIDDKDDKEDEEMQRIIATDSTTLADRSFPLRAATSAAMDIAMGTTEGEDDSTGRVKQAHALKNGESHYENSDLNDRCSQTFGSEKNKNNLILVINSEDYKSLQSDKYIILIQAKLGIFQILNRNVLRSSLNFWT